MSKLDEWIDNKIVQNVFVRKKCRVYEMGDIQRIALETRNFTRKLDSHSRDG